MPAYSGWLAYSTVTGMRSGLAGFGGGAEGEAAGSGAESKRQKKMEKRGGQRMQHR